ncbi:MAG: DUF1702 family protein [Nostoc sp.]|uniref:DUF1702 family protein n=1 Tax=Nostoc sp. TaxID=1180 RepID=UPI002FF6F700
MAQDALETKLNEDKTLPVNIWAERGIPTISPSVQQRLRQIRGTLLQGFQAAIASDEVEAIILKLNGIEDELRGFAFEGVGMGLTHRDLFAPSKQNRVEAFVAGSGAAYEHFVYVGVGLMLGKPPLPLEPYISQLNPTKLWLVIDGYGFQHGLSHWQKYLDDLAMPEHLSGYARRVFDQGMGRSIWFVDGADVTRIPKTIGAFPPTRQADLWGGIGFVCTYSGGVGRATLEALKTAAGHYQFALIQGSAFAAKSRQRIGSYSAHTELACEVLSGMRPNAVAENINKTLQNFQTNTAIPEQEVWQHYRAHLAMPSTIASST